MFRTYLRPVVTGVVAVFLLAGTGFAETYRIDPTHSSVGFSIRHIFSQVKGQFGDFSGEIVYDPKHEENSSVAVIIQVASIDTENERRDNHTCVRRIFRRCKIHGDAVPEREGFKRRGPADG